MTKELLNGYTQRTIGQPVLLMLQSMMGGNINGMGAGTCQVSPNAGGTTGSGGLIPNSLPIWSIYTIAGVGGAFLLIVIIAVAATLLKRR
jgi:hypothetical protein